MATFLMIDLEMSKLLYTPISMEKGDRNPRHFVTSTISFVKRITTQKLKRSSNFYCTARLSNEIDARIPRYIFTICYNDLENSRFLFIHRDCINRSIMHDFCIAVCTHLSVCATQQRIQRWNSINSSPIKNNRSRPKSTRGTKKPKINE